MDRRQDLTSLIEDVEPIPANYKSFVKSVRVASRRHIPRGCRTEYIPGLTDESKSLYEAYKLKYSSSTFDDGTIDSGNTQIDKMTEEKGRDGRQLLRQLIVDHTILLRKLEVYEIRGKYMISFRVISITEVSLCIIMIITQTENT